MKLNQLILLLWKLDDSENCIARVNHLTNELTVGMADEKYPDTLDYSKKHWTINVDTGKMSVLNGEST